MRARAGDITASSALRRQLREMPCVDALQHVARQACERERALGSEHVADLLPRGLHELVLILPHDFGAPSRGQSIARLQHRPSSQWLETFAALTV